MEARADLRIGFASSGGDGWTDLNWRGYNGEAGLGERELWMRRFGVRCLARDGLARRWLGVLNEAGETVFRG